MEHRVSRLNTVPSPISLTRARPTRTPKQAFLIICTDPLEAAYAEWLKTVLEHSQASVLVREELAEDQPALIRAARKLAREAAAKGSAFDEIWFFGTYLTSPSLPRGVHAAIQPFGIREWLLAHFEPTRDLGADDEISGRLSAHLPKLESDPRGSMTALVGRTETARRNVEPLRQSSSSRTQSYVDLVDALQDSLTQFKELKTRKMI
jgi:hypothetical protein